MGFRVFMDSLQLLPFILYIIHHTLITLNFGPGFSFLKHGYTCECVCLGD